MDDFFAGVDDVQVKGTRGQYFESGDYLVQINMFKVFKSERDYIPTMVLEATVMAVIYGDENSNYVGQRLSWIRKMGKPNYLEDLKNLAVATTGARLAENKFLVLGDGTRMLVSDYLKEVAGGDGSDLSGEYLKVVVEKGVSQKGKGYTNYAPTAPSDELLAKYNLA